MKNYFLISFLLILSFQASGFNSLSTVNTFSPGTSQVDFTSIETPLTLEQKNWNFLFFFDSAYQSLAVYNSTASGDDLLSFAHMSLSYGLSSKLELGLRGPLLFNQNSPSSQSSLTLTAQGFTNIDTFAKYKIMDSVKSKMSLMGQIGVVNGNEVIYSGPNPGLNYALSLLYERSLGKWKLGSNVGYILRNPSDTAPGFAFFEPLKSSIVGSVGLGRPLNKSTRVSAELLMASHDFVKDNSDRGSFSSEALLSFHSKLKNFNVSYGLGTGLTNGISTPTVRGFLGLQYVFGFKQRLAKVEEPAEDAPQEVAIQEDPKVEVKEEVVQELVSLPTPVIESPKEEIIENTQAIEQKEEVVEVKPETKNQKIILNNIEFEFGSYILNTSSQKTLDELVVYLRKNPFNALEVWGHTDFYGSSEYNEFLGLKRAKSVYDYFIKKGVPTSYIKFDAFGERRPVSLGILEEDRKKNRRVEIIVIRE